MPLRPCSRSLQWIGAFALAAALVAGILLRYSKNWLVERVDVGRADLIVVLGGESGQRAFGAAELYHAGVAPRVFVSGGGDCLLIVRRLLMAGVPEPSLGYECRSRSTRENAFYTRAYLGKLPIRKAVLVTSWYHTARARRIFERTWPEVSWGVHPVHPGENLYKTLAVYEGGAVLAEYLKTVLDAVRP